MEWIIIAEENVSKEYLNPSKHSLAKFSNYNEELLAMCSCSFVKCSSWLFLVSHFKGNYGKIVWATVLWTQSLLCSVSLAFPGLELSVQPRSSFYSSRQSTSRAAGKFKPPPSLNLFILSQNPDGLCCELDTVHLSCQLHGPFARLLTCKK